MSMRRRGFTLVEMIAALIMLGLLYAVSLSVFNATYVVGQQSVAAEQVQVALTDGLQVAGEPGNHFSFPSTTLSGIALILTSPLTISTGPASGSALSGFLITGGAPSSNDLLVASYSNGVCVLGLASTSGSFTWATADTDPGSCVATDFAVSAGSILGTKQNPSIIGTP